MKGERIYLTGSSYTNDKFHPDAESGRLEGELSTAEGEIGRLEGELDATPPRFVDNLHFEDFDKYFNLHLWCTSLSKSSKWRLSTKRGGVADGCITTICVVSRDEPDALSESVQKRVTATQTYTPFQHKNKRTWPRGLFHPLVHPLSSHDGNNLSEK